MSSDIKNDLINWNAEQLSDDSPVYNSKDLINALNSIMPSLGSAILTTNNHVLSKQEDWDNLMVNTINMFTTLANSGLPANHFPNNSGVLLVLGYTSYNIYIAISGEAVYYRLGGADWNKLLTSETIKDLTGSVTTLTDNLSKLSDQQTTLNSLFNTFKDDTNKQLDTLNTQSTSQAKLLGDLDATLAGVPKSTNEAVKEITGGLTYLSNDMMTDVNGGYTDLQKLKEFKNSIDTDAGLTRIAFATDTHHEAESNWRPHMTSGLRHALNPMYVQDVVDAVIFNGDNINNGGGGDKATANYLVQDFSTTVRSLVDSDTPVLINKGNHDNNYKDATIYADWRSLPSQVLTNAELAHYYGYDIKDDRIIRDGNSAYCYINLPNNVRMYMLDSYDTPEILDKDGYLDFNARQNSIYGQKQLQWLANTLDASKTTVLFAHNPVEQVFGTGNAGNEVNHDVLHQLLNAFVSGGNGTINGVTGITVKYAFDKAGTIAGVFTGHLHKSSMVVNGTINYVQTTCQAVYADGDNQEERNSKFGTWQEDAFDVIEIDPVKKHVKLKRYGYGEDRDYDY